MLADSAKDLLQCGIAVSPVVDWRLYGKLLDLYFLISALFQLRINSYMYRISVSFFKSFQFQIMSNPFGIPVYYSYSFIQ